jgi:hypothetical protein
MIGGLEQDHRTKADGDPNPKYLWVRQVNRGIKIAEETPADRKALQSVKVREASFDDHRAISSLESRYELETKSYKEWSHLWRGNLLYRDLRGIWTIGWVLETGDKRIVGYLGNIPRWYEFQGQRIIAAATHAWVVDCAFRSYSILLLDRYFNQKNVDLYLSTSVNSQSSRAFAVFNSPPVPVGAWDRSAYWVTHYRGFAASWAAMKALPLSRLLSYAFSAALLLRNLSARRGLKANRNDFDIEFCDGFDDRFDGFWDELKRKDSHVLLALRSREVLESHFKFAMLQHKLWVLTTTNGGGLAGYSIFLRQDNPRIGLKRIRLVDFQVLDESGAVLSAMLSRALKRCRQEGIHMLEYIGCRPEVQNVLENLGPQERRLPCWLYYYKAKTETLARSLTNPAVWNPSCFDGDSSL